MRADPVVSVTRGANTIELRVIAFDGYTYRVEGSSDGEVWDTVSEPHQSINETFTVTVPASGQWRFFRVVLL